MLTKGQRTAGRPNWTRKDYQVIAEFVSSLAEYTDEYELDMIIEMAVIKCNESAALTPNGNRNFNEAMFRAEVQALLDQ